MRKSIIVATLVMSGGLIAGAQASEREHFDGRRSSHMERHADNHDDDGYRDERHHDRRNVSCQTAQRTRLSVDELRAKLTSAGYQVWRLEAKRNGCVEAKVSQSDGSVAELHVDPATAEIKARR